MKSFYRPSDEILKALQVPWIAAYSGGKDSTSMIVWVEWLLRSGVIRCDQPMLVQSDTGVEYPFIQDGVERLLTVQRRRGWDCHIVKPQVREKLYCQIFGRGLPPIHPGMTKGRWCTRSTKVDPMRRYRSVLAEANAGQHFKFLTGVRWGESGNRDEKLKVAGCSAGGECGTNIGGEDLLSPIINWTTCQVFDFLNGYVASDVRGIIGDLFEITRYLASIYKPDDFDGDSLRFGCVACPALSRDKVMDNAAGRDPRYVFLQAIYGIWRELYKPRNRLCKRRGIGQQWKMGPLRMAARKEFYEQLKEIQRQSGIVLVTLEDEAFILQCWAEGVYPRGWSAADELTAEDNFDVWQTPLYRGMALPLVSL